MTAALWRLLWTLQRISCVAKITLTRRHQSAKRGARVKFSGTVHNLQHLLPRAPDALRRSMRLGHAERAKVRQTAQMRSLLARAASGCRRREDHARPAMNGSSTVPM